jgi:hypothetical protein
LHWGEKPVGSTVAASATPQTLTKRHIPLTTAAETIDFPFGVLELRFILPTSDATNLQKLSWSGIGLAYFSHKLFRRILVLEKLLVGAEKTGRTNTRVLAQSRARDIQEINQAQGCADFMRQLRDF